MEHNQRCLVGISVSLWAHELEGQGPMAPGVCHVRSALQVLMLSALVCWCPKLAFWAWTFFKGELHIPKGEKWPLKVTLIFILYGRVCLDYQLGSNYISNFTRDCQWVCLVVTFFGMHQGVYNHTICGSSFKNNGLDQDLCLTDNLCGVNNILT